MWVGVYVHVYVLGYALICAYVCVVRFVHVGRCVGMCEMWVGM